MPDKTKQSHSRSPRKITERSLRNIALHYLQRFSSSRENLKRVLMRRVIRSAQFHDIDTNEASGWVDHLVEQLSASGLVDDRLYAEGRMRALFRRGVSPKGIRQRLQHKGVDAELIEQVLAELYLESANPDLEAAIKLVRRRRLGPYRQPDKRQDRRDKDLAAVARAGFDYQTSQKVIDAETVTDLEDLLDLEASNN